MLWRRRLRLSETHTRCVRSSECRIKGIYILTFQIAQFSRLDFSSQRPIRILTCLRVVPGAEQETYLDYPSCDADIQEQSELIYIAKTKLLPL